RGKDSRPEVADPPNVAPGDGPGASGRNGGPRTNNEEPGRAGQSGSRAKDEGRADMPVNDPVGDMLTRIRNASRARHDRVVIPTSKMKVAVARVLREAGYIADFVEHDLKPQGTITLQLKYGPDKSPPIN